MSQAGDKESPSRLRMEALMALQLSKYELWKHFEDRADCLGDFLLSIGIWVITVITFTLKLSFPAGPSIRWVLTFLSRARSGSQGLCSRNLELCCAATPTPCRAISQSTSKAMNAGQLKCSAEAGRSIFVGCNSHRLNVQHVMGSLVFTAVVVPHGIAQLDVS